jgi:hypothetical protein
MYRLSAFLSHLPTLSVPRYYNCNHTENRLRGIWHRRTCPLPQYLKAVVALKGCKKSHYEKIADHTLLDKTNFCAWTLPHFCDRERESWESPLTSSCVCLLPTKEAFEIVCMPALGAPDCQLFRICLNSIEVIHNFRAVSRMVRKPFDFSTRSLQDKCQRFIPPRQWALTLLVQADSKVEEGNHMSVSPNSSRKF